MRIDKKLLMCIALPVMLLVVSCGGGGTINIESPDNIDVVIKDNADDKDVVVESKTEEPKKPEINRRQELPKDDNTFLVQTVESVKEGVYVSGLSGWCGTDKVFVPSSDRVFTFWLGSARNEGFEGWFWRSGSDEQTIQTSYYNANDFYNNYYKQAVKMNAFHPIVCSYKFDNYGNTFLELYQVSTVLYSQPDPVVVGKIELFPEYAILSDAPDVVVEPDFPPFNLGGWLCGGNVIAWEFDVDDEDEYGIYIDYSRPYVVFDILGTLTIQRVGGSESTQYSFKAMPTTRTMSARDDWSVYELGGVSTVHLEEGTYRLEIYPEEPYNDTHFINLRSVILLPGDDPAEGDAYIGTDH